MLRARLVADDGSGRHRRGQRERHRGLGGCHKGRTTGQRERIHQRLFVIHGAVVGARFVGVLARWSARLTIERGGRDIDTRCDFTVVVGRDNVKVADEPQQRTAGDGETNIDTVLPSLVFGAAETINGSITLTPQTDMSNGELGIYWGRRNISHPLVRTPAIAGGTRSGQTIKLGKGITLCNGTPVTVPFAVPLPDDAPPTGEAVHSSLRVVSRGHSDVLHMDQGIETVRRQVAVVNAPSRVRPAKSPRPPRSARGSDAPRCNARTVPRPAAR
jgi:hypothetical protein